MGLLVFIGLNVLLVMGISAWENHFYRKMYFRDK